MSDGDGMRQARVCEYFESKCLLDHSFPCMGTIFGSDPPPGNMTQPTNICEDVGLSSSHGLSIFSLPPVVRRQIYCDAGLVTGSRIDLNRHFNGDTFFEDSSYSMDSEFLNFSEELA